MNKSSNKYIKTILILVTVLAVLLGVLLLLTLTDQRFPHKAPGIEPTVAPETVVNDPVPTVTDAIEEVIAEESEETEPYIEITLPEVDAPEAGSITYQEYLTLPLEVQQAYYENFESPDAFFDWLSDAEAVYEAEKNATEATIPEDSDIYIEEGELEEWEEEWDEDWDVDWE